MRIRIHASKVASNEFIENHVERRLNFALGRFADVVRRVEVTLADINGPKGGHDKLCRIRVALNHGAKPVIAEVLHEELITAVDLSADRIGRAVARAVDRESGVRISRRRRAAANSRHSDQMAGLLS